MYTHTHRGVITQQYKGFFFSYLHGSGPEIQKEIAADKNETERDGARKHEREGDGVRMIERIKSLTGPECD